MQRIMILFILLYNSYSIAWAYRAGVAKVDITGPIAGRTMLGYANPEQQTSGIHHRLYARAFIFETKDPNRTIALVISDLAFVTQKIKLEVIKNLEIALPGVFSDHNVLLAANHTHSGPGGFSQYMLYNISTSGFSQQNFDIISSGISRAIVQAYQNLREANLYLAQGKLSNASMNRSKQAYERNLDSILYSEDTNKTVTQINIIDEQGKLFGILNWFAVHTTSMSNKNKLISGDNKGVAALLFEKKYRHQVVAGFFNGELGDVSPNISELKNKKDIERTLIIGQRQYQKAEELSVNLDNKLDEQIDYQHLWVKMDEFKFKNNKQKILCQGAMGHSFAAGAEDGPSELPGFYEGMRQGLDFQMPFYMRPVHKIFKFFIGLSTPDDDLCHYPKPVLISTGKRDSAWTPKTLPFQLVRLGQLAIIAAPSEVTTMAGRQLRKKVKSILNKKNIDHVITTSPANSYSGYLTTIDEYSAQHYEGASTIFGPYTHDAYMEIYSKLARHLLSNKSFLGPRPIYDSNPRDFKFYYPYDDIVLWRNYGDNLIRPKPIYEIGQRVYTKFQSANPSNDPSIRFMEIQKWNEGKWKTVASEDDLETVFYWKKSQALHCLLCSYAHLYWTIPKGTPPGIYRIAHHGRYKPKLSNSLVKFSGYSSRFFVHK